MDLRDLMTGCVMSALCLVLGLVPGLFNDLTIGVRNFSEQILLGATVSAEQPTEEQKLERPLGLALIGVAILAFTVVAYALEGN